MLSSLLATSGTFPAWCGPLLAVVAMLALFLASHRSRSPQGKVQNLQARRFFGVLSSELAASPPETLERTIRTIIGDQLWLRRQLLPAIESLAPGFTLNEFINEIPNHTQNRVLIDGVNCYKSRSRHNEEPLVALASTAAYFADVK